VPDPIDVKDTNEERVRCSETARRECSEDPDDERAGCSGAAIEGDDRGEGWV